MNQKIITVLFSLVAIPSAIMAFVQSIFGWAISIIWLMILGKWSILGDAIYATIGMVIFSKVIAFVGLIFYMPAEYFLSNNKKLLGKFFNFLSHIYILVVITVCCVGVLWRFVNQSSPDDIIPVLMLSFVICNVLLTDVFVGDLQNEQSNVSMLRMMFVSSAYFTIAYLYLVMKMTNPIEIAIVFFIISALGFITQSIAFKIESKHQNSRRYSR